MIHIETLIGAVLVGAGWVMAWRRRRQAPPPGRALAFFGGLVALLAALNGPVHDLAEHASFAWHMVQHLILTLAVPPLLLLGTSAFMIDGLLDTLLRDRRWMDAMARWATNPVATLGLYGATLIAVHLPGPFNAALESHAWHVTEHAALLASGLLAWWPVLAPSRRLPALPYAAQLLYVFAFGMPMTVVAAMITGAERVLYPFYATAGVAAGLDPLGDQRLGGVLMWVPAGVVPLLAFTLVFFRWAAEEAEPPGDGRDYTN
jgi:putative membrane protein